MESFLPQLPHLARHALAAVTELATLGDSERLKSSDLAALIRAPQPVLSKVLRALAHCGLVDGLKGHNGGYRLARPAADIRLVDVVACATGVSVDELLPQCALGVRRCNPRDPCALHTQWSSAIEPVRRLLMDSSVAEIVAARSHIPPV
jgi:Rrf2 family protein